MPFVVEDIQAFSAFVAELPSHLREYGHKLYTHTLYTHTVPTSVEVANVRTYQAFAEMLKHENAGRIVPDDLAGVLNILQSIYPKNKEGLGVCVFEFKIIKKAMGD